MRSAPLESEIRLRASLHAGELANRPACDQDQVQQGDARSEQSE